MYTKQKILCGLKVGWVGHFNRNGQYVPNSQVTSLLGTKNQKLYALLEKTIDNQQYREL